MEFNILIGNFKESDKNLFFGPLTKDDKFEEFISETSFPQLLKELGIFKSSSQARKAGWNKEIPHGWSDFTIGKKRHRICILKIMEE